MPKPHLMWEYSFWKDRVLLVAIIVAAMLHIAFLLVSFVMPEPQTNQTQDIAIAIHPSAQKIENSDFIAQYNQQGSGQYKEKHKMATDMPPAPQDQTEGEKQLEQLQAVQQKRELHFDEKVLMTVLSWQKQTEDSKRKKIKDQLDSQLQAKAAMIASLEAQYLNRQQAYSHQQNIKTIDSIQAKQDASAGYLEKFREKVELYGNQYYPEQAKQQQLAGQVRLMVILNQEGGIRAIRLLESSGHNILDEAAKNSVRRGAPFGRFDKNMQNISELRIVRTWRFDPAQSEFNIN